MELITVREIFRNREKYLNKEIQVGGWVRSNRDSKAFGFLVLHDGTFFETLQIVYHDTMENFQEIGQDERRCSRDRKRNTGCRLRRQNSLLRSRQKKSLSKVLPHRIIRCRRSATAWSICVPSPICVPEPTRSRPYSVYVP